MIEIGTHDYIFASLEEKVAWMQAGQGTNQTFQTGDGLKRIAGRMQQSDDNLGQSMRRRLGQSWQGQAAAAAGDSLARTAAAMTATAGTADHGGGSTHGYGSSFTQVKNVIGTQPPRAIGHNSIWGEIQDGLGFTSDYRTRLTQYRAANKLATDALQRHENTARQTLAGFQEAMQTAVTPPSRGGGDGTAARTGSAATHSADTPETRSPSTQFPGTQSPGTQSAGSGTVGAHPGSPDGWTPLSPPNSTQVAASGSAGGVPVPNYPGSRNQPLGGRPPGSGIGGPSGTRQPGGWPGGHQPQATRGGWASEQQLGPRSGSGGPDTTGEAGRLSGGSNAAGPAGRPGMGGMPTPMGMGGGSGSGGRQHRNQCYQPSDEPFRIDVDDFTDENGNTVAPPVIGMPVPNAAPRLEPWERW